MTRRGSALQRCLTPLQLLPAGGDRVLVLNHFASPEGQPGGTRHVELYGALDGWACEIVAANRNYLTRQPQHSYRPRPTTAYRTVWTWPYAGNGAARVLNWASYAVTATAVGLLTRRPSVVVGSTPHLLAPVAGWLVARLRRVPFVLEVRDLWPEVLVEMGQLRAGSRLYRSLEALAAWVVARADAIVVLAPGVATALVERGVDPARVHLVPNGADLVPPLDDRGAARAALGAGADEVLVVYAGAHGPANGLDLALDAAADLAADHPEVRFVFVGDGPVKGALVERASREHLANVRFEDARPKAAMPEVLGAADVGLHVLADVGLFTFGVSPNKVFDYLAAGLPVLTNVPGDVGDLVTGNGAGVAVAPDAIADGLRALLALLPADRAAMGERGRALIERDYAVAPRALALAAVLRGAQEAR